MSGSVSVTAQEKETGEEGLQRRLKESARVEERVVQIYNEADFQQQLEEVSLHGSGGQCINHALMSQHVMN